MNSDEKAIRDLVAIWMEATKAGDTDSILGLMADDAKFLVAGHPPFGKEAFKAAAKDPSAASVEFDGQAEILELNILGDWAYTLTSLTVTTRQAGYKDLVRTGHTLSILKKQSGRWLLYRDANLLASVDDSAKGE